MIATEITVKQARGLLLVAPKNDPRYYLNGVLISATDGRMVATDGRALLALNIRAEGEGAAIIDHALLDMVAKGGKADDELHIAVDGVDCTIKRSNGQMASGRVIDGTFPDYWRVIPAKASGEVGHYNPDLLAKAAKALKLVTDVPADRIPYLSQNGTGAAVLTCNASSIAIAVVMPCRFDKKAQADAEIEYLKFKDRG